MPPYRAGRLALFRRVVAERGLTGVALAHHAADQAETVALRLLRGGGPRSLVGMAERSTLGGLTVLRPLLHVQPAELRAFLLDRGQPWREDASNVSVRYLRNRVRPWLAGAPATADALRTVAAAARAAREWLDRRAPGLEPTFAAATLADLPGPAGRHAAGRWLASRGVPADALNRATCERLVAMAADAATPPRQVFPGAVSVNRRGGWLAASRPSPRGR